MLSGLRRFCSDSGRGAISSGKCDRRTPSLLQFLLHPHMTGDETEPFIETPGVRTLAVGGELHHAAAAFASALDGEMHELSANAAASQMRGRPHAVDRRAPGALIGEGRREGELK